VSPTGWAEVDEWDPYTLGVSLLPPSLNLRLMTRNWSWARLTFVDVGVSGFILMGSAFHVGTTAALGIRHGPSNKRGDWLFSGAWYGSTSVADFDPFNAGPPATTTYRGFFLPMGYEHTERFAQGGMGVWGFRLFVAASPWGASEVRNCNGSCDSGPAPTRAILGSEFFIGY